MLSFSSYRKRFVEAKIRRSVFINPLILPKIVTCLAGVFPVFLNVYNNKTWFTNLKCLRYFTNPNPRALIQLHELDSFYSSICRVFSSIGDYLGFFESFKNDIALNSTNNCQTASKYYKKEREVPRRIIWWRRIFCSIGFLITGIYSRVMASIIC